MTGEFIGVEEEGDGASEGGEGMSGDEIEGVKAARTAARKLREFVRIGNMTAVGCMSSVSQEWSIIAFPFLWKVVVFTSQDNKAVRWFIDHVIPRHASFITGIRFRISHEGNDVPRPLHRSEDPWDERERNRLAVELRMALPNLDGINTDFSAPVIQDYARITDPGFLRHDLTFPGQITVLAVSMSVDDGSIGTLVGAYALGPFVTTSRGLRLMGIPGSVHGILTEIGKMSKLERLDLVAADFFDYLSPVDISQLSNATALSHLHLKDTNSTLAMLVQLIQVFPNLTALQLNNSHDSSDEEENEKYLDDGVPFLIPSLRILVITNVQHQVNFFRAFDRCQLSSIGLMHNPQLSHNDHSAIIGAHRTTLRFAALPFTSEPEAAYHRSVCEPLGIEVEFCEEVFTEDEGEEGAEDEDEDED